MEGEHASGQQPGTAEGHDRLAHSPPNNPPNPNLEPLAAPLPRRISEKSNGTKPDPKSLGAGAERAGRAILIPSMSATLDKIPLLDLSPEINELWDELNAAIQGVLRKGSFIMGENVKEFEKECAAYFGVKHALALNSGTDALVLGLNAMGIGPGDEVITTPFTFFATGEAVSHFRATPVFVDIDPENFNLDVAKVEAAITPRTKAILPVHLYGQPVDMDPILDLAKRHNLLILEDVAQAFGAEYKGRKCGAIGHGGAFSFFPSKNLGAFGDGGLFITDDDGFADSVRMMRVHGSRKKYYNEAIGVNSRLDEIQAAILRVKFPHIDAWNEGRRAAAHRYNALLADVEGVITPKEEDFGKHVYHQYTVRILDGKRDAVQKALEAAGIGSFIYYPVPLHKLPVYKGMDLTVPIAEQICTEALSLPIWPKIEESVQARVVGVIRDALQ
jgi:dTDP-4-amino-4,6-dideoxygalactose transaminase